MDRKVHINKSPCSLPRPSPSVRLIVRGFRSGTGLGYRGEVQAWPSKDYVQDGASGAKSTKIKVTACERAYVRTCPNRNQEISDQGKKARTYLFWSNDHGVVDGARPKETWCLLLATLARGAGHLLEGRRT